MSKDVLRIRQIIYVNTNLKDRKEDWIEVIFYSVSIPRAIITSAQ
jgi:hypothetical protein